MKRLIGPEPAAHPVYEDGKEVWVSRPSFTKSCCVITFIDSMYFSCDQPQVIVSCSQFRTANIVQRMSVASSTWYRCDRPPSFFNAIIAASQPSRMSSGIAKLFGRYEQVKLIL
mgnify:CR=1 FL=1